MKYSIYFGILFYISLVFQSCDPTYPVSIKNNSGTEIVIESIPTNSFNPGLTTTFITEENNQLQFKIKPGQEFECGFTIGELKYDLPFSELIIYSKKDTIIAKNKKEVLELFDKNWMGNLKTPYIFTVE